MVRTSCTAQNMLNCFILTHGSFAQAYPRFYEEYREMTVILHLARLLL